MVADVNAKILLLSASSDILALAQSLASNDGASNSNVASLGQVIGIADTQGANAAVSNTAAVVDNTETGNSNSEIISSAKVNDKSKSN